MTAFLIALLRIDDETRYRADYTPHMQASLDPFGGRYLSPAAPLKPVEGDFGEADLAVLIAFPNMAAAEAWYASAAYAPLLEVRRQTAQTRLAFLDAGPSA